MHLSLKILLLLLFVASGATSLLYQTIWIRVLSLGVGSTSASMSLVLSIFFMGLSAGSYLCGKYAHRFRQPLLVYGFLEGFIGIYGALVIYPLFHLHHVLALFPMDSSLSWLGFVVKLGLVAGLLTLPTMAMGATLPLLIRLFVRSDSNIGQYTSLLYGINTIGAVAGAFLTGFVFIPRFGIVQANHAAAVGNLLILGISFLLAKRGIADILSPVESTSSTSATVGALPVSPLLAKAVLLACGLCGFVSIASEVVWNKYLGIFFGTNIYGLGLVLAIYLLGIAVGSLVLSRYIGRVRDKVTLFAQLFLLSIALMLVTSYLFNHAPRLTAMLLDLTGDRLNLLALKSLVTAAILFLPTCVFGALLPLGIAVLSHSKETAPKFVGQAYAINTVGAILGSYLAGIVLIPTIGSSNTIRLVVLVGCAGAVFIVRGGLPRARHPAYFGVIGVLTVTTFLLQSLDFRSIIKSAYHRQLPQKSLGAAKTGEEEFKLIIEGETAVISLSHDPRDGAQYRSYLRLKTNGLNESVYDRLHPMQLPTYEALIGVLPYVFSEAPKRAFVVGYGGGYTVDFLTSTDLEKVDVIELEKGILTAADYVHHGKNPLLHRKSLDLRIEDARYVLATKQLGKHDIIISQPSHSWLSGAANLFTQDFFEIVKEGLTEKGVFSQWLNLYNMDVRVLKSILRTFYTVFPEGAVFTNVGDQELVLVGAMQPLVLNWERLNQLTTNELFRRKLAGVPISAPLDLLTNYAFSRTDALKITEGAVLNTDVNAYAETHQSALFYKVSEEGESPQDFLSRAFTGSYPPGMIPVSPPDPDFLYRLLTSFKREGQYDKFHVLLKEYEARSQGKPDQYWNLGYLLVKAQRYESAATYLGKALAQKSHVGILNLLLSSLVDMERYEEGLQISRRYPLLRDKITDCYLADLHLHGKDATATRRLFNKLTMDVPAYTNACGDYFNKIVGNYFFKIGNYATALPFYETYTRAFPHDQKLFRRMREAYSALGQTDKAESIGAYAEATSKAELKHLRDMGAFYRGSRLDADAAVLEAKAARLSVDAE